MTAGFWGSRDRGVVKLVSIPDHAEPSTWGVKVLAYVRDQFGSGGTGTVARGLFAGLDLVDGFDVVEEQHAERWPVVSYHAIGQTFADALDEHAPIAVQLANGVALDATRYEDAEWGYILDFGRGSLEVYTHAPIAPGDWTIEGLKMVVDFYLQHPPTEEAFLEGIREELQPAR